MKNLLKSFVLHHPMVEDARPIDFGPSWVRKLYLPWVMLLVLAFLGIGVVVLNVLFSFPLNWLFSVRPMAQWIEGLPDVWESAIYFSINMILSFGGIYLIMTLYARLIEKRSLNDLGFKAVNKAKKFVIGFLFGFVSMTVVVLLIITLTDSSFSSEALTRSGWQALPLVLLLLVPWTVQASAEEVVFQGWLTPHLTKRYGLIVAVSVAAFLFMLAHALNPGVQLMGLLNLVLYGLFAAFYMLHERSILGIAGYHIAWNWAQGQVYGALVSGGAVVPASLFGMRLEGHRLLTGGTFGPEGSLVVTGVLFVSLALVFLRQHQRNKSTRF